MRILNRHGIRQKEVPAEELEKVGDHHLFLVHRKVRGSECHLSGDEHLSRYDKIRLVFPTRRMQVLEMIFEKCFPVDEQELRVLVIEE